MLFSLWSICLDWSTHILQMCCLIIVKSFDSRLWRLMRNSVFLTSNCSYILLLCTVPDPRHCLCALYQLVSRCSMSLHSSVSFCPKLHIYNPDDFQWDKNAGLKTSPNTFLRGCFNPHLGISGICTPSSSFRKKHSALFIKTSSSPQCFGLQVTRSQGNRVLKKNHSIIPQIALLIIFKKLELHFCSKYHNHCSFIGLCRRIWTKWGMVPHIGVLQDTVCCATQATQPTREWEDKQRQNVLLVYT